MFTRQGFVVVGIIVLAVILGLVIDRALEWTWIYLGWDNLHIAGLRQLELTKTISFVVAVAAAVVALKHPVVYSLANEVVDELSKVNWPTREETGHATIVVIVTVFVCAAYLGAFDAVWLAITDWVLGIEPLKEG